MNIEDRELMDQKVSKAVCKAFEQLIRNIENEPGLILEGVPQENFLALPFGENKTQGVVVFHKGFNATE